MFNYQINIEYDGTKFVGWQSQKNGISIQDIIQRTISKIFKQKIKLLGAGRTDTGVHATGQSAHFLSKLKINNKNKFLNSINFFLNKKKITILNLKQKANSFHSRFDAKKRTYKYLIINRFPPPSLDQKRVWHVKKELNLNLIKKGTKILEGKHDFSTFRSSSCSSKSPIKTLNKVSIKKFNDKISLIFISRSFLQNQVRSMVGCLKYLGEKKWNLKKFKKVMYSRNRSLCAPPAPPHGLYLEKIDY